MARASLLDRERRQEIFVSTSTSTVIGIIRSSHRGSQEGELFKDSSAELQFRSRRKGKARDREEKLHGKSQEISIK